MFHDSALCKFAIDIDTDIVGLSEDVVSVSRSLYTVTLRTLLRERTILFYYTV